MSEGGFLAHSTHPVDTVATMGRHSDQTPDAQSANARSSNAQSASARAARDKDRLRELAHAHRTYRANRYRSLVMHWMGRWLRRPKRFWGEHLYALPHDMSTHVLPTGALRRSLLVALGHRARELAEGLRGQALLPLVLFYEEDLVQHCLSRWERAPSLKALSSTLHQAPSVRALRERLEERGQQARDGEGGP